MRININSDSDQVVLSFTGFLDFESVGQFSEAISSLQPKKKLVFDFKDLEFVGSSGIKSFIDTIDRFYKKYEGQISLSGVEGDFKKIVDSYECSRSIKPEI